MTTHPNEPNVPRNERKPAVAGSSKPAPAATPGRTTFLVVAGFIGGLGVAALGIPTMARFADRHVPPASASTPTGNPSSPEIRDHAAKAEGESDGPASVAETLSATGDREPSKKSGPARVPSPKAAPVNTPVREVLVVEPAYPALAKSARIQGSVEVQMTVDEQGRPAAVTATSGASVLRAAAESAAAEWRFHPATRGGKTVPSPFHIRFDFKLQPDRSPLETS